MACRIFASEIKQMQDIMNAHIIPTTTLEAYEILDGMLSREAKKDAIAKSGEEFAEEEHFGLGIWICNNWFYAAETPEQQDSVAELLDGRSNAIIYAPDMLSCRFLEHYHEHLLAEVA